MSALIKNGFFVSSLTITNFSEKTANFAYPQLLYSKGFGYTDQKKKTPVTDDTLFGVASISKSFAAALLVKLLLDERTKCVISVPFQKTAIS